MTERANVPLERLDYAITHGAEHHGPIWRAVRDHGCLLAIVTQGSPAFDLSDSDKPRIVVIGDDAEVARGPTGFDRVSRARAIRDSGAVVIVSSAATMRAYSAAADFTVGHRGHSVIVETRLEFETISFGREMHSARWVRFWTMMPGSQPAPRSLPEAYGRRDQLVRPAAVSIEKEDAFWRLAEVDYATDDSRSDVE